MTAAPHARARRTGTGFRFPRAVAFATVCVALSAGGHQLASHGAVPGWALALGFLLSLAVAVPFTGRTRSLPAVSGALAVGQLGLHCLFGHGQQVLARQLAAQQAAAQQSAAASQSAAAQQLAEHAHHLPGGTAQGAAALQDTAAPQTMPMPMHDMGMLPDLPMLLGHLFAALALGWLLRRGDLALTRLVELSVLSARVLAEGALVRSLRAALSFVRALQSGLPASPAAHSDSGAPADAPAHPRTTALAHTVIRRGPPAGGFVLTA